MCDGRIEVCDSYIFFFFFQQKTAYELRISDWSSGVCSSDLIGIATYRRLQERACEGQVDGVSGLGTIESQRRCGAINREKNRCIAHQQALLGHRRRIALA